MRLRHLRQEAPWFVDLLGAVMAALVALMAAAHHVEAAEAEAETTGAYRVGVHVWKPGSIYDEALNGIRDGLRLNGMPYEEIVLSSNRDNAVASENLRRLDEMDLDVIFSLSSAGTKIARDLGLRTPVVATVINHPASLGLDPVTQQTVSGRTTVITGASYYVAAEKHLTFYLSLFPQAERIGR